MNLLNVYRVFGICICLTLSSGTAFSQNPPGQDGRGNPGQSPTQPRNTPGQTSTSSQADRDRTNTASATTAATSFAGKAIEISSAEIQLGQLASRKAQNDRVKSFAQMMVKDHTDGLSKLQRLQDPPRTSTSTTSNQPANNQTRDATAADNKSTRDTTSPSTSSSSMPPLSAEHRQLMTRLEGMSGAQFDREYMNAMVNGHREAIKLFEQEAGSTSSTSTTARTETENRSSTNAPAGARDKTEATTRSSSTTDTKNLASEMLPAVKRHLQEAEAIQKTLK